MDAQQVGIGRFETTSLRLVSGPLVLEVGRMSLHDLAGRRTGQGTLDSLQAASAELSDVKVQGPLLLQRPGSDFAWSLAPLAGANGSIRAEIVDAQLLFDADVTVPIRQGQIDFGEATVEHVGPDSRMGVSRMGIYVDAPNGRSYLYQFPSAPVAGVQYERRGVLPGPWGSDRGKLQLQAFGEALLRQFGGGLAQGLTEQARLLLARTALAGELRLGDGAFAAPGARAELAGRGEGRNTVRLHSEAVGRGIGADIASLLVRRAVLKAGSAQLRCDEVTGASSLRLFVEDGQLRFALSSANLKIAGLRLAT